MVSYRRLQPKLALPKLISGALCLDFVNTVDPRHATPRREYLDSYENLLIWGTHAGAVNKSKAREMLDRAESEPAEAKRVLARAVELREALYRLFASVIEGHVAPEDALDCLNRELAYALANMKITYGREGPSWAWEETRPQLDRVLWPIVRSAADLLVEGPLDRVRECPGQGTCGWLFLDVSKNGRRQWCDMRSCGNRAKARRHYARVRDVARAQPDTDAH